MPNIPSKLNSEITDTYFVKDNTFFAVEKYNPMDLVEKEIGDSKVVGEFLPQQKIARWDNEVNFSARLVHNELTPTVSTLEDKIVWDGEKVAVNFYDIFDEANPEGASEFEVILKEKPKTNVVSFTLNTKGLDFFYQPEIEDSEVQSDVKLTPEELLAKKREMRPENVVGSYAVYASENKVNYVGGKEYKCGKVGHIFRPQIEDAEGNKVWGDLKIDTINGILSVTIPQDFLDKAVYPVRHAAGLTFGYTTAGGSTIDMWGSYFPGLEMSPVSNGSAASISVYMSNGGTYSLAAIYSLTGTHTGDKLRQTGSLSSTSGVGWKTGTLTSELSVISGTTYIIAAQENCNPRNAYYDSWTGSNLASISYDYSKPSCSTSYTLPSTFNGSSYVLDEGKLSIYATYTAAATGYSSPFPSFKQI